MQAITTVGLDIAKSVSQAHSVNSESCLEWSLSDA
jgi:hypothetical protein